MLKAVALPTRHCRGPRRLLEYQSDRSAPVPAVRPSILLVTLDTTRADAIGPDAPGSNPSLQCAGARPLAGGSGSPTRPPRNAASHSSMMTASIRPATACPRTPGSSTRACQARRAPAVGGYRTAGSSRRSSLTPLRHRPRFRRVRRRAPAGPLRPAVMTTDRASPTFSTFATTVVPLGALLRSARAVCSRGAFRTRYAATLISAKSRRWMTAGRLVQALRARRPILRDCRRAATARASGSRRDGSTAACSIIRRFTCAGAGRAGDGAWVSETRSAPGAFFTRFSMGPALTLAEPARIAAGIVLGEAMKPFSNTDGSHRRLRWRRRSMDSRRNPRDLRPGRRSGRIAKPRRRVNLPGGMRRRSDDYPIPSVGDARPPDILDEDAPAAGQPGLHRCDRAAGGAAGRAATGRHTPCSTSSTRPPFCLFVKSMPKAIPLFERILAGDPNNLDAALRLATAHSLLGDEQPALEPSSEPRASPRVTPMCATYLALHYARQRRSGARAIPPARTGHRRGAPAAGRDREELASLREREGNRAAALALRQRAPALRPFTRVRADRLGDLAMSLQHTATAIEAFEARSRQRCRAVRTRPRARRPVLIGPQARRRTRPLDRCRHHTAITRWPSSSARR